MAGHEALISAAKGAIGEGDSNKDWMVVPTEHAQLLGDSAEALAKNLRGSRPQGLASRHVELDRKAVQAQRVFKRTVARTNQSIFATATFAALLLVAGGLQGPLGKAGPWVVGAIGILGVISAGLAAMWLTQVKGGNLLDKWFNERAKAEAKRLAYFKAIMEGVRDDPSEQLLALEYTRRFLLDNQIDYFRGRGAQHEGADTLALKMSSRAVFASSTFTAVAGLLAMLLPQLAVIAGLGVIAAAYSTLVLSRSAVDLNRRNADRYRNALDRLEERRLDIDIYREKAAAGEEGAVQEFFEPVFVTLEADHKAFLSDRERRESAIGAMEERLDAAKQALSRQPAGGADNP